MSKTTSDSDALFQQWKGWLDTIHIDVRGLHVSRYIYRTVIDIVEANPNIQTDDTFYAWITTNYVAGQVIGIRRQLDNRTDSVSLARLLQEMIKRPQVLSRERYVALYEEEFPAEYARRNFNNLAGGGQDHVNPESVASDLFLLKDKAEIIGEYASKKIAHWDEAGYEEIPTCDDLDSCPDYLEKLLTKYINLFTANSLIHILPTWQYDWTEIFQVPWISKGARAFLHSKGIGQLPGSEDLA